MSRRSVTAVVGPMASLGVTVVTLAVAAALPAQAGAATPRFATVHASVVPTANVATGAFQSAAMSVEVVLAPSHEAQLQALLGRLYDKASASYGHWLSRGQFAGRFAPSRAESVGVARYLSSTRGPASSTAGVTRRR